MLDLAIVDKLNRAGFVVAPYSTPEEESSVKSVSGPAVHSRDKRGYPTSSQSQRYTQKPKQKGQINQTILFVLC